MCERSFRPLPDDPEELQKLRPGTSMDPISSNSQVGCSSDTAGKNSL